MKIVLWIGNEANQKALANKIHKVFPLSGIITESRKGSTKITLGKVFEKVIEKLFLSEIGKAWWGMKANFEKAYPSYPAVRTLDVENINSEEAFAFTNEIKPDLIIVSGTRLVKKKMLSLNPSIGILNLHTGLSPYIKGGPNCTNWSIATEQFHLIGNTIMWIDAGIDTGDLLKTELTTFEGNEDLAGVHSKVMEHAHDLYLRAIQDLNMGKRIRVKQNSICEGTTYYTRQWGLSQKYALLKNFKKFAREINSADLKAKREKVITVS